MRFCMSNIAWDSADDERMISLASRLGIALEAAPGRLHHDPAGTGKADAPAIRQRLQAQGVPVLAMQSLLFGRPDLTLFGTPSEMLSHLSAIFEFASGLGAGPLVFGAPRNRRRGHRSTGQARREAIAFFEKAVTEAGYRGVVLCLEPNAPEYGCDFVTNLADAAEIVRAVGSPHLKVQVDTASMDAAGEHPLAAAELAASGIVGHVHLSEDTLVPPKGLDHRDRLLTALSDAGYAGTVSLEMRKPLPGEPTAEECMEAVARLADRHGRSTGR